ncbi:MAG: hypothetical protein HKN25_03880 [Pyrinomonadaceae bacterium]|nr:hypothetical protein [Pyrinomonadaceae bacterium]
MDQEGKYVVAAEVDTQYKGCVVAPEDAMIMATHTVVFGPDTKENCENWKRQNCI